MDGIFSKAGQFWREVGGGKIMARHFLGEKFPMRYYFFCFDLEFPPIFHPSHQWVNMGHIGHCFRRILFKSMGIHNSGASYSWSSSKWIIIFCRFKVCFFCTTCQFTNPRLDRFLSIQNVTGCVILLPSGPCPKGRPRGGRGVELGGCGGGGGGARRCGEGRLSGHRQFAS